MNCKRPSFRGLTTRLASMAIAGALALSLWAPAARAQSWWETYRNNEAPVTEAGVPGDVLPPGIGAATLECLDVPKKKGYPKQRLFVAFINGRVSSYAPLLPKKVDLPAGNIKVVIRNLYFILGDDYEFEMDVVTGRAYDCRMDMEGVGENFIFIVDRETGRRVAKMIAARRAGPIPKN